MKHIIHYATQSLDPEDLAGARSELRTLWKVTDGIPTLDRTKSLDLPFDFTVLTPIPKVDNGFSLSFKEVCLNRAEALWKLSDQTGKEVCVYWSGGIDSTTALVSLLMTANTERLQRLIVRHTKVSIKEYPLFFFNHIQGKLRSEERGDCLGTYFVDLINVTGELGDQIFGSAMMFPYSNDESRFSLLSNGGITKKSLEPLFSEKGVSINRVEPFIEYIRPLMQKAPFELKSCRDLFWWMNFSIKWQDVECRMVRGVNMTREQFDESLHHFFNDHDMQQWSMNEENHQLRKMPSKFSSYKAEAKELIYEYTGDVNYLENKLKVGSLRLNVPRGLQYKFRYSDMTKD